MARVLLQELRRGAHPGPKMSVSEALPEGKDQKHPHRKRTMFTEKQLQDLTLLFNKNPYPDPSLKREMASKMNLDPTVLQVWFKNHRAKLKKEKRNVQQNQEAPQQPPLAEPPAKARPAWSSADTALRAPGARPSVPVYTNRQTPSFRLSVCPPFKVHTDPRETYRDYIRRKFRLMEDRNARLGECVNLSRRYTRLLLVKEHADPMRAQQKLLDTGRGHARAMGHQPSPIQIETLFEPDEERPEPPRTVVLQGPAGMGKSMLAHKLMLDWADGRLFRDRFDYLFYINCRELNRSADEQSPQDLLSGCWPESRVPLRELACAPERLLLILDGFDELKPALGLCSLAAEGLWHQKILFEEQDLRKHGLDGVDVSAFLNTTLFQKDIDCEKSYSFIHLSFQEFFAAMHYILEGAGSGPGPGQTLTGLLTEYGFSERSFLALTVRFLFGLLNEELRSHLEKHLCWKVSPHVKMHLLEWIQSQAGSQGSTLQQGSLELFSCLYEIQEEEFIQQALSHVQVVVVSDIATKMEHMVFSFCARSCKRFLVLHLNGAAHSADQEGSSRRTSRT
ncbi:NACHT, LRR and PYD domains-containing protein 12 [Sciurus carolinensis]|uniref:NACHT, LRR and PYD domains-containing protein 12 n=1 Tax=Sciurus carolinensis TaxID=30640 RepID=A0AA41MYI9_SCICA|nr:NACHT, LRR and PYD domains-containing protein 12 [Sciurus carolinensis]